MANNSRGKKRLFMVAGEASADSHGADLIRELKTHSGDVELFGVGGSALIREGMDIWANSESLNVVGSTDFMDRFAEILGTYRRIKRRLREHKPDCAVLIDLPDFNLRLARYLKRMGVPVVYYISPQVWAWRKYRISTIQKFVDRMLVVFPFEKEFYLQNGVEVTFVGHPLVDRIQPRSSSRSQTAVKKCPRIAVLPGSRRSELRFHAPILSQLIGMLEKEYPDSEIRIPVATTLRESQVREAIPGNNVSYVEGGANEILHWADVAVVASGTATLETALVGTPFCLFYQMSKLSNWIMKYLARYKGFLGMPNLLHGRSVVREFLGVNCTADLMFPECRRLIEDEDYRRQISKNLNNCRTLLGTGGAGARAAKSVFEMISREVPGNPGMPVAGSLVDAT